MLHLIAKNLKDLDVLGKVHTGGILKRLRDVETGTGGQSKCSHCLTQALSGRLLLKAVPAQSVDIDIAEANAAAVGTLKRQFAVSLEDTGGMVAEWAAFAPVISTAEVVTDADVDAPVVTGTPTFNKGRMLIEITLDTDEGDEKVYADGDKVSVTVKTTADSKLWGWPVADLVWEVNFVDLT